MTKRFLLAISTLALISEFGCASAAGARNGESGGASTPSLVSVEYDRLELESRSITGATYVFKFTIKNDSPADVVFNAVKANLSMDSVEANFKSDEIIDVLAGTRKELRVQFKVAYPREPARLEEFLAKKVVSYNVTGVLSGMGEPIDFGVIYEVGTPSLPEITMPGASMASSDKGEAGFTFDIVINNSNVFPLKIDYFDYHIGVEDVPCGTGRIAEWERIPPNSQIIYTFSAKMEIKTHEAKIREMLAKNRLNWTLTGIISIEGIPLRVSKAGTINFSR